MGKTVAGHPMRFKGSGMDSLLFKKMFSTFDGRGSLSRLCLDLLAEQKKTWQDLQKGHKSLKHIQERDLICSGFSVRLQYNPGRMRSSTAEVGEKKEIKKVCFLCLNQLPEGQKGILYQKEYLILCNPMPVFPFHFTVSHIDHRRQDIVEHISTFINLSTHLGPHWIVLYNGPRCGASAPNHLHFQIAPSGQMPIEREILEEKRLLPVKQMEGVYFYRARGLGRELILLEGEEPSAVESALKKYLNGLKKVLKIDIEPMINIIGFYQGTKFRLLIFPRQKHRPDAFFKTGEERIVVSPGAVDMGGILITPVEHDFNRLNSMTVESIYKEVSMETGRVKKTFDDFV